jgi:hypothetical protein
VSEGFVYMVFLHVLCVWVGACAYYTIFGRDGMVYGPGGWGLGVG